MTLRNPPPQSPRSPQAAREAAPQATPAAGSPGSASAQNWLEQCSSSARATTFWLNFMFFCARRVPWFMRGSEWMWMGLSKVAFRKALRPGPRANARWLLGPDSTPVQRRRLVNRILRHFYRFIYDVGRSGAMTRQQILDQVESVQGQEHYYRLREQHRGVLFTTAHLGSFEVGLAAIAEMEPGVHVVFQRDVLEAFDQIREQLHRKVGVTDALVERGIDAWMGLRDVLQNDGVVLMQGDRVMPGHRGQAVAFMGGHVEMPLGPIKLAALSGAPILPVFAIRLADGRTRLVIEAPIEVSPQEGRPGLDEPPASLKKLAGVIEKQVRAHPEQWLMLSPMWCEDQKCGDGDTSAIPPHEAIASRGGGQTRGHR